MKVNFSSWIECNNRELRRRVIVFLWTQVNFKTNLERKLKNLDHGRKENLFRLQIQIRYITYKIMESANSYVV